MRVGLAVLLAACIVLAGCAASPSPTPGSKTSTRTTSQDDPAEDPSHTHTDTSSSTTSGSKSTTSKRTTTVRSTTTTSGTSTSDGSGYGPPWPWPSVDAAKIRPGVQTFTDGAGQCTANFVFTDRANTTVYIGQAAHCGSLGAADETNGCLTDSLPVGTSVDISTVDGGSYSGVLVYSSWQTMHERNESDDSACQYNDFALIEVATGANTVHPSMLHYGGPVAMADASQSTQGEKVLTYGNSGLRLGLEPTSPKEGYVLFGAGTGWTADIWTATPGVPGDSGSGVMNSGNEALCVLVTVALLPIPSTNGCTTLSKAVAYANAYGGMDVQLATAPVIDGGLLPNL